MEKKMEAAETTHAGTKRRAEKPVPSSNDGGSAGDKKTKSKQNHEDYKPLILDVLKQINPSSGISRGALTFLNDYINDFSEKVSQEASRIAEENSIDIITPRELDAAVYRILPEDFAKRVVSGAHKDFAAKCLSS